MKTLLTAATAAAMVLSATAAQAATRPEATRLAPPVSQANDLANETEEEIPLGLILAGLGGLIAVLVFAASSNGNSPR